MAGLRERKKQATRAGIVEAALRLFADRGYAATSVAQIADAADVSPATFFVYFPAKEDVVFADQEGRVEAVAEVLRARGEREPLGEVLRRALHRLLETGPAGAGDDELLAVRGRVVAGSPELRSAAAGRLFAAARRWADVLLETDPALDPLAVHATLGAALGAAVATAAAALDAGEPLRERVAAAVDLALAAGS